MSDDLDPGLKRLFALTAEPPADEAFVAAVEARTSRERLVSMALRGLGLTLALALGVAILAIAFRLVAGEGAAALGPLAASLAATGYGSIAALGLVIAAAVCGRALHQVIAGWRGG
jgi:hypothetical protein